MDGGSHALDGRGSDGAFLGLATSYRVSLGFQDFVVDAGTSFNY